MDIEVDTSAPVKIPDTSGVNKWKKMLVRGRGSTGRKGNGEATFSGSLFVFSKP